MMRAIRVAEFGGPEVLKVETDVAIPKPDKGQVRSCCPQTEAKDG